MFPLQKGCQDKVKSVKQKFNFEERREIFTHLKCQRGLVVDNSATVTPKGVVAWQRSGLLEKL